MIQVPVYRWEPPVNRHRLDQLIGMIVNAEVDAVSFTSAPAVASILERAKAIGCVAELLTALRGDVGAICVGPVTSAPLRRPGVPATHPDRYRLGALARLIRSSCPRLGRTAVTCTPTYRRGSPRAGTRTRG